MEGILTVKCRFTLKTSKLQCSLCCYLLYTNLITLARKSRNIVGTGGIFGYHIKHALQCMRAYLKNFPLLIMILLHFKSIFYWSNCVYLSYRNQRVKINIRYHWWRLDTIDNKVQSSDCHYLKFFFQTFSTSADTNNVNSANNSTAYSASETQECVTEKLGNNS